jgi:hypothetical protein
MQRQNPYFAHLYVSIAVYFLCPALSAFVPPNPTDKFVL